MKNNKVKSNILVIDSIPFFGGSKVATKQILDQCAKNDINIAILTSDSKSWVNSDYKIFALFELPFLSRYECGIAYFFKHIWIALFVFIALLRCGKRTSLLGASGPGVDLSIYIVGLVVAVKKIQLVQGPVALSKTIGRCFLQADFVAYLPSTLESIKTALKHTYSDKNDTFVTLSNSKNFMPMQNGISRSDWPTQTCQKFNQAHIFWAASLLKWKGLDYFCSALQLFPENTRPSSTVCYIEPKGIDLEVSNIPRNIKNMQQFSSPKNLDQLRASHNIFVSTSHKEPFGLSILEAMAAGLCIVIPEDGAYWDTTLKNNINCFKYKANDFNDLHQKLDYANRHMSKVKDIAHASYLLSQNYKAEITYLPLVNKLTEISTTKRERSAEKLFSMGDH